MAVRPCIHRHVWIFVELLKASHEAFDIYNDYTQFYFYLAVVHLVIPPSFTNRFRPRAYSFDMALSALFLILSNKH